MSINTYATYVAAKPQTHRKTIIAITLANTVAAKQNPHFAVKLRVLTAILAAKMQKVRPPRISLPSGPHKSDIGKRTAESTVKNRRS